MLTDKRQRAVEVKSRQYFKSISCKAYTSLKELGTGFRPLCSKVGGLPESCTVSCGAGLDVNGGGGDEGMEGEVFQAGSALNEGGIAL